MFCPKCGTQNDDNAFKCVRCGEELHPIATPIPVRTVTCSKAIWSLVLGILSITCFWIFAGIPAIILGIIAKKEIKLNPSRLSGMGLATAGFVLGIIGTIIFPIVIFPFAVGSGIGIVAPGFLRARENSRGQECQENLTKIDGAKEQWALEWKISNGTACPSNFLADANYFGPNGYVK